MHIHILLWAPRNLFLFFKTSQSYVEFIVNKIWLGTEFFSFKINIFRISLYILLLVLNIRCLYRALYSRKDFLLPPTPFAGSSSDCKIVFTWPQKKKITHSNFAAEMQLTHKARKTTRRWIFRLLVLERECREKSAPEMQTHTFKSGMARRRHSWLYLSLRAKIFPWHTFPHTYTCGGREQNAEIYTRVRADREIWSEASKSIPPSTSLFFTHAPRINLNSNEPLEFQSNRRAPRGN